MEVHNRNKHFFKELCSSTLWVEDLNYKESNIFLALDKLARIFPPGFFNVMEHLPFILCKRNDLEDQLKVDGCIHLTGDEFYIYLFCVRIRNISSKRHNI